jgi:enamine deaminase RidA (YjgF/YER057c/UK114 family)
MTRMSRNRISSGSRFEDEIGYSRAVVDGDWVFVSGTTGYDYATMTIAPGVVEQCDQAFKNIEAALKQAHGRMEDIVRATFILPDRADWPPCWPVVKMVAGLQAPEMRIEIEVTARLRRREGDR